MHSIDAEQAVLGAVLNNQRALDDVMDVIQAENFSRQEHRLIYQTILDIDGDNNAVDVVTVSDRMEANGLSLKAGGLEYLATLANNTPSSYNAATYARLVHEAAIEREMRAALTRGFDRLNEPGTTREKLDAIQADILGVMEGKHQNGPVPIATALSSAVTLIEKNSEVDGLIGLSSGFVDLDKLTNGLQAGDMVVIAGRPSMGKTSLAMNIAEHNGLAGKQVLVFSLEMPTVQLTLRHMASIGRMPLTVVRSGKLEDEHWDTVTTTVQKLSRTHIHLDDDAQTILDMHARARRLKRQNGLDLIVIDYLQLVRSSGENRTQEITKISGGVKRLAKELDVPVLVLSQLNRGLENRVNKRPTMADLRESGAIEQDADVIIFIYRDEVYDSESPAKGTAEIIIGKQRNGPTGVVRLVFENDYCRFQNYVGPVIEAVPMRKKYRGGFDATDVLYDG